MRPWSHVLIVLLLIAAPARADWDDEARARSLYERGMAHFQLEEYEVAIQLWQQAYRLKPAPQFLYNIAQAYRFSSERALSFYKKFLSLHPHAANRAEVERQIATLTRILNEQETDAAHREPERPPVPVEMKTPAFMAKPARAVVPPPAIASAQVALLARPPDGPIAKKGWFWAGLGITVAAVAVGVGVGVGFGLKPNDPNPSFGLARGP